MASKGNTWCKKLMTKAKANAMKHKLGNEQGVLARGGNSHQLNHLILETKRRTEGHNLPDYRAAARLRAFRAVTNDDTFACPDKPVPLPPRLVEKKALPKRATIKLWSGKKIIAKDVKGYCEVARDDRLAAQVRALVPDASPTKRKPFIAMSKAELRALAQ